MKIIYSAAKLLLCAATVLLALSSPAQDAASWSRTFTSTDGRQLVAVPLSKTDTTVTIRRADTGQEFVLSLDKLSEADQAFVKAWTPPPLPLTAPAPAVARPRQASEGPVAGKLVIVPINEGAAINPLGAGMLGQEPLKDSLFVDISAAGHHVIAVTEDGKPICFGMNQDGKPMVDVLPKTKRKMVACTAGEFVDFLIDEDGRVEVMRGEGTIPERQKLKRIFGGAYFGLDRDGHLKFIGPENERATYEVPAELKDLVIKVARSGEQVVAITEDGTLSLWGKTGRGQLPLPPEVTDQKIAAVGIRDSTTIAVREDGKIIIWGEDRKWWSSKLETAPGTVQAWDLSDGYWGATIFHQNTPDGSAFTVYSNSGERDAYLQKTLDEHKPIKITQTKDAIVMIRPVGR